MKLNKKIICLAMFLCCLPISGLAQKDTEKPFQKWSKEDAIKILNTMPWSQTYQSISNSSTQQQIAREQNQTVYSGGSNPRSYSRNFGPPPIVVRLHSSLSVRRAIVRLRQIDAKYDKMSQSQQQEFDNSSKGFLNCAICENYYVITITKFKDSSAQSVEEGIFQRMSFEQLKGNIWLENEKGERRELAQFNAPKNADDMAVFYFARKDDKGNPLLTNDNKNFQFKFKNEFLTTSNPYASLIPRQFEFGVPKLISGGKIDF